MNGSAVRGSTELLAKLLWTAYDNVGRRTRRVDSTGNTNNFGCNNRSEITAAFMGTNTYAYRYAPIGNRTTASRNSQAQTYTANSLNQYTQRTVPGIADIIGSAGTNVTVTVNKLPVTRYKKYWHKALSLLNSSSAAYSNVTVVGVYNPPGTNDEDSITIQTGKVFAAKTPEQFSYDDDGNLLSDGRWSYTWDAENRLIAMETATNLPAAVPRVRLAFQYDYMSRRIGKGVYNWVSNAWVTAETRKNIFNGWDLIREDVALTGSAATTNWYVHGLDLSGSLAGAGGIGGILAAKLGTNTVVYTYCGNGNVSELINTASNSVATHYEYDAFGQTLVAIGPLAKENLFRFSTKPVETHSGVVLYEFRPYGPSWGRWASRDPIGEYSFMRISRNQISSDIKLKMPLILMSLNSYVDNNAVCKVDALGLWPWSHCANPITINYTPFGGWDTISVVCTTQNIDGQTYIPGACMRCRKCTWTCTLTTADGLSHIFPKSGHKCGFFQYPSVYGPD